ncbi:MAG TPA: carbamoyltransferase N-terminal domain-containing protein [Polyangiaceae bacterium]|nr:carbamoyltransferase N-terminal domain-containing protein [Polyangiaceae bacterium]
MAAVLGVSALYHDAAAALVVDGRVAAAMQEERFSRQKNDPGLPLRAARACLARAGLGPGDLDAVVFYENPYAKLGRVLRWQLRSFPRSFRQFPKALGAQLGSKLWALDRLAEGLGVERARVTFGEHHRSHAASAFFTSPFDDAAVLTVDGVGEEATTAIWRGRGRSLEPLARLDFPHSIGLFYGALTAYLGFEVNEGEYKVMGLAAFGEPSFGAEFEKILRVGGDGSFELEPSYFAYDEDSEVGFSPALERLLGPRRPYGRPWALEGDAGGGRDAGDRRYADVAASLQAATERALLALAREARRRTGSDALCLAGGVALNAVANARLLREAGFARLFVHPAAGDAGGALGAAVEVALGLGDPRPAPLASASLGLEPDLGETRALALELGLEPRRADDPSALAAELVARGRVVAFCAGRFEWGPRALGQRSLLALPEDPAVRERLNRVVKRREPFRPFAPAALEGEARALFEGAPNDMTPFMTAVCRVRDEARPRLGAVTHVDGTARVQTVTEASSPELFGVLGALARAGAPPVVLNTSLNGPGEPICASGPDALAFFLAHPVDDLLVGDLHFARGRA